MYYAWVIGTKFVQREEGIKDLREVKRRGNELAMEMDRVMVLVNVYWIPQISNCNRHANQTNLANSLKKIEGKITFNSTDI